MEEGEIKNKIPVTYGGESERDFSLEIRFADGPCSEGEFPGMPNKRAVHTKEYEDFNSKGSSKFELNCKSRRLKNRNIWKFGADLGVMNSEIMSINYKYC